MSTNDTIKVLVAFIVVANRATSTQMMQDFGRRSQITITVEIVCMLAAFIEGHPMRASTRGRFQVHDAALVLACKLGQRVSHIDTAKMRDAQLQRIVV